MLMYVASASANIFTSDLTKIFTGVFTNVLSSTLC